jgi:hypothetical protein
VSPRFRSTALAPAAPFRTPSVTTACARSVDVVVPSPTASQRSAASRTICAPRFSTGSVRSHAGRTVGSRNHALLNHGKVRAGIESDV